MYWLLERAAFQRRGCEQRIIGSQRRLIFLPTAWTAGAFSDGEEGVDDEDEYNKKSEGISQKLCLSNYI